MVSSLPQIFKRVTAAQRRAADVLEDLLLVVEELFVIILACVVGGIIVFCSAWDCYFAVRGLRRRHRMQVIVVLHHFGLRSRGISLRVIGLHRVDVLAHGYGCCMRWVIDNGHHHATFGVDDALPTAGSHSFLLSTYHLCLNHAFSFYRFMLVILKELLFLFLFLLFLKLSLLLLSLLQKKMLFIFSFDFSLSLSQFGL